jgi:glucose/arabinose dehydrogenase
VTLRDRGRVPLGAVLIAALALAACSGDDAAAPSDAPDVTFATQPSRPTGTEPAAPTTGATDPTASPVAGTAEASTPTAEASPSTQVLSGDPAISLAPIASFEQPVDLAWRSDDTTAFIVERVGRITPLRNGVASAAVLDITDLTEGEGERGLLGLTFSADGSLAYVNHTDNSGDTVIAEYVVAPDGTFDESSRRILLTIDQPYANHNGGDVTIGPDGMLYIGMGDGGDGGDPQRHALNVSSLLGKMLRIDPAPSGDAPYTVPADNPFVGISGARPEIWSVGLRNPWRFSFDSETGDLWIADVGQNVLEEIDVAWATDGGGRGLNFGWSAFEGSQRYNDDQSPDGATPPIHEYEHGDLGCSISGGAVYRGTEIPALVGWYVWGDYCSGQIQGLRVQDRAVAQVLPLAQQAQNTAIRVGPDGELWAISIGGEIARIVAG